MMRCWDGQGWRRFSPGDLAPDDRGFLLGDGIFETMRVAGGRIRHSAAHRERFEAAARALDLASPAPWTAVDGAAASLSDGATLRLTLTRGSAPRGLAPAVDAEPCLFLADFPPAPAPASLRLATSAIRRSPSSLACRHKTLSYADNAAARREAVRAGAEMALLLTCDGHLSGSDSANLFWMAGGTLFTPSQDCAIRPGVTRQAVLDLAGETGLSVREGVFGPGALSAAEAVFVTNAAMGVVPVRSVDGEDFDTANAALQKVKAREATAG